jgi:hypothetical protein
MKTLKTLTAAAALMIAAAVPVVASESLAALMAKVVAAVEEPCRQGLAEQGIYAYTCNSAKLRNQEIENWQLVLRQAYVVGGGDVHARATDPLFSSYNQNLYGAFPACGVDWTTGAHRPPVAEVEGRILGYWKAWAQQHGGE